MSKKLEEIKLRSEQVQDILSYVPHWMIRYGNLLFLGLIILFFSLSWLIKYPDVITTEALLTTQVPPEKLIAQSTGKLNHILIKDNDLIAKNTPLAIIENNSNFADVYKLKSIVDTIKVNTKSFNFPVDQLPVLFLGDIDTQYALFENNYIQYTLNKDLKPFSNEALAHKTSISELHRRLKSNKEQLALNRSQLALKRKDLTRYKTLFEKGTIARIEYENKQIEFLQAEQNLKSFESSISQLRESIGNANKSSKGTEINKTKEEMILLKSVIQSFRQLKKAIRDWETNYVLKSNINGKVSFSNYWSTHQTVNQGDLVFTIIPSKSSTFIAKLKTPAINSGKLKIGQTVNIKLENYPEAEFGTLQAKVNHITLIPDQEGYYLIRAKLPNNLITSYKKPIEFKQEMRGSAEIITEKLRLTERFFYQVKDIFK
ncbi:HlyD family secretion protein [Psychroserpens sp. NJDZ02]|uniref:HlyD family secretion protein n=1 Tax=Psychroserpens sp. NJDZ02 TaxID=2570561 RepID=UPI0010A8DD8E|nr:HlyD family efflux transporter periplasmic adaptor subunit [Psychroserpens sp. NJDZ02]QCE40405.1 HlyD family efflux transporter periplasmic adaptor subunit [Psychroserpens sp. NJDZ02]